MTDTESNNKFEGVGIKWEHEEKVHCNSCKKDVKVKLFMFGNGYIATCPCGATLLVDPMPFHLTE